MLGSLDANARPILAEHVGNPRPRPPSKNRAAGLKTYIFNRLLGRRKSKTLLYLTIRKLVRQAPQPPALPTGPGNSLLSEKTCLLARPLLKPAACNGDRLAELPSYRDSSTTPPTRPGRPLSPHSFCLATVSDVLTQRRRNDGANPSTTGRNEYRGKGLLHIPSIQLNHSFILLSMDVPIRRSGRT